VQYDIDLKPKKNTAKLPKKKSKKGSPADEVAVSIWEIMECLAGWV
jgi:hypothetical protein